MPNSLADLDAGITGFEENTDALSKQDNNEINS